MRNRLAIIATLVSLSFTGLSHASEGEIIEKLVENYLQKTKVILKNRHNVDSSQAKFATLLTAVAGVAVCQRRAYFATIELVDKVDTSLVSPFEIVKQVTADVPFNVVLDSVWEPLRGTVPQVSYIMGATNDAIRGLVSHRYHDIAKIAAQRAKSGFVNLQCDHDTLKCVYVYVLTELLISLNNDAEEIANVGFDTALQYLPADDSPSSLENNPFTNEEATLLFHHKCFGHLFFTAADDVQRLVSKMFTLF